MAKKAVEKAKAPEPEGNRVPVLNLKGSRAYADWFDRVAKQTHFSKATIIRLALVAWAEAKEVEAPPES